MVVERQPIEKFFLGNGKCNCWQKDQEQLHLKQRTKLLVSVKIFVLYLAAYIVFSSLAMSPLASRKGLPLFKYGNCCVWLTVRIVEHWTWNFLCRIAIIYLAIPVTCIAKATITIMIWVIRNSSSVRAWTTYLYCQNTAFRRKGKNANRARIHLFRFIG